MARIILIETSTSLCSVGLSEDGVCTHYKESPEPRAHAAMTAPYIKAVLDEAGLRVRDCDAVCVSKGPGSYTGLRVGSSTAKGLSFGAGIPLIALGTLDILAAQALSSFLPSPTSVIPGQTSAKPDSLSVIPGQTSAKPDSLSVIPGQTSAKPGAPSVIPGQTSAKPDSLSVIPGQTSAKPGAPSVIPGQTSAKPGSLSVIPGAPSVIPGLVPGISAPAFIIPMIDARRMEVYTAVFSPDGQQLTPTVSTVVTPDSFAEQLAAGPVIFIGDGALKCRDILPITDAPSSLPSSSAPSSAPSYASSAVNAAVPTAITVAADASSHPAARFIGECPRASSMAALAEAAFRAGRFEDTAYFEPFYLKDFVATLPRKTLF